MLFCTQIDAQTSAFPGAEGGGMYTTGGRGGKVIYVTNLNDSGTGSLRAAISQSGARTIIFKVSGLIELKSTLEIKNGNLTIAGQTAPGDGICLKNYEMVIKADNVIVRYMRFRLGDLITTHEPDALWGRFQKNIMIDHCSVSWSIDECASFYSNQDFTMQWCFIAESLNQSLHGKGDHGYGAIWGGKNATFHHNLLAHHNSRNPRFNGWNRTGLNGNPMNEERVDFRNNVIYNWGSNSVYGGESSGKYNMVANYYKYGPATNSGVRSRILEVSMDANPATYSPGYGQFYITDNYMYGNGTVTNNNWSGVSYNSGVNKTACKAIEPFECYPITQHTAEMAFDRVLDYAGASLKRDAVDTRIAKEVRDGSYTYAGSGTGKKGIIDSQVDVGGWPAYSSTTAPIDSDGDGIPDFWEDANGLNKNDASDAKLTNAEGYTYLEVYLNSIVKDITEAQLNTSGGGDGDVKILFCGSIPTSKVVPDELNSLISAGNLFIADQRTDGCTENGYTWRTSDVTFTLPAKAMFSANFTSNGGRTVYVTINGDEANKKTYRLTSSSCEPVSFTLEGETATTIRIESYNSSNELTQFSMTDLCIKEILTSSIGESVVDKNSIKWTNDMIYVQANKLDIFSVRGSLVRSVKNIENLYIGDLLKGVYIVRLTDVEGKVSSHKFVKR